MTTETPHEELAPRALGPSRIVVAAAAAMFLALALCRAAAPNFWNDEIISITLSQRSWYGLVHGALQDLVHTPIFYSLLKVWTRVWGDGALAMRLLPISFGVLSLIPAVLLCRELRLSRRASALALGFAATSGFLVYYSQEVRPYSLLLMTSATSLWTFARVALRPTPRLGDWLLLAAAQVLLGVTHYYGWLVVATEGLYLLIVHARRVAAFVAATLPAVGAFIPWAYLILRRIYGGHTLERNLAGLVAPGPVRAIGFFSEIVGPCRAVLPVTQLIAGTALFLLPALWITARSLRRPHAPAAVDSPSLRRGVGFLATFAFIPVLISLLVSWFLRPVFHPRYLIGSVYPFVMLSAVAIDSLRLAALRYVLAAAALAWSAYGALDRFARPDRVAWGDVIVRMRRPECHSALPSGRTRVYVLGRGNLRPVRYYLKRLGFDSEVVWIQDLSELPRQQGWLAFSSGSDLERIGPRHREGGGPPFWGAIPIEVARAALEKSGDAVLCELSSGTPQMAGDAISFVPATAR
jgi:hypothetical protein